MEFSTIHHMEPDGLLNFDADLFITTLGFESRCTHIARRVEEKRCRKVALSRSDHLRASTFQENRGYYEGKGFEIIPIDQKVPDVGSILGPDKKSELRILMDCTSMSPEWYYEFFRWFVESQDQFRKVRLRVTYTMAAYDGTDHARKIKKVSEFFEGQAGSLKVGRIALLLGLGHERHIGEAIHQIVKPDQLYLFYADPAVEKVFAEKTLVNNHSLIESIPIRNLIAYPIQNGQLIYQSLIDTILPLRHQYTILLVPHGPKIFSLAAMLAHLRYPDTVISYPEFKKPPDSDRIASGEPVLLDLLFESEE
jgi:hypothetical protein